jgi:hypothetical protein
MGAVEVPELRLRRLSRALSFMITHPKIVQVEVIADPVRLRELDLAVLQG